jgi:transposase
MNRVLEGLPVFPPKIVLQIKALACELPYENGVPLSRFSTAEIASEAQQRGIVAQISGATVWRWLHEDALKPWHFRSWIFPRDPDFETKAARVLDLYHGKWEGTPLRADEYVVCADEKTRIQVRRRKQKTLPIRPGKPRYVEHEYERAGVLNYLAAWDVKQAALFGRCEPRTGIQPFRRLVHHVMQQEPYRSARRVFWIVDNGSSHRGQASIVRLQSEWPTLRLVHLPIHASWLNQIEIYFSILQRKVLTPNDFDSVAQLQETIQAFEQRYQAIAQPFQWKFTRKDLARLMKKIDQKSSQTNMAA